MSESENDENPDDDSGLWEKFGAEYADKSAETLTSWKRSG